MSGWLQTFVNNQPHRRLSLLRLKESRYGRNPNIILIPMLSITLQAIAQILHESGCSLSDILKTIIQQDHSLIDDLSRGLPSVLDTLKTHVPKSFETVLDHTRELVHAQHVLEIKTLTNIQSGWHFSATNSSADQLEQFLVAEMGVKMARLSPSLWAWLDTIVPRFSRQRIGDSEPKQSEALIVSTSLIQIPATANVRVRKRW
jgi:hypothetical protein